MAYFNDRRKQLRDYYAPALEQRGEPPTYYTNIPSRPAVSTEEQLAGTAKFGMVAGGMFAAGYLPFGKGRVWDKYIAGLRGIEEYSPGQVLRTFQLSAAASRFGTHAPLSLTPEFLLKDPQTTTYMSRLIGEKHYSRIISEGVRYEGGKLFWGTGQDVALKYASLYTTTPGAYSRLGAAYARSIGTPHLGGQPFHEFFADVEKGVLSGGRPAQIIGGRNLFQAQYRRTAALGTELVSRFNRLLELPFELPGLSQVYSKFTKKTGLRLAVKEGGGLNMFARMIGKFGVALPAAYLGYQTLDYYARQSSMLDDTIFGEGITAGIATIGIKSNLALSRAAEATGLHSYREAQERIAPDSTELTRLAGFPLAGALAAGTGMYGLRVGKMAAAQFKGLGIAAARETVEESLKSGLIGKLASRVGMKSPLGFAAAAGAALGLAAVAPFIPGALIPSTRPDELEAIYQGKKDIAVRKGRWWLMGRTPLEGERILMHKQHWYPLLQNRARERAIWKEDETGGEISPLEKFWKKEFTYYLEDLHAKERPYPVSATPFTDVPFIGPLLASTLGRFIKPTRLLNTSQWLSEEGVKVQPPTFGQRISTRTGEAPGGLPVSEHSALQVLGEQLYRGTEMVGLPGFTLGAIKQKITGREEFFDQDPRLETASRIASYERKYWDLEVGDPAGLTEFYRRLFPHRRRQIDLYNPIRNAMPQWLPGPSERGPDLQHGDPFTKIPMGELRLPGAGYAVINPEVRGVDPAKYPLIHQYKILADVAMYTDKFKAVQGRVRGLRKTEAWGDREEEIFQTVKEQLAEKKDRTDFAGYKYLSPMGEVFGNRTAADYSSDALAAANAYKAGKVEDKPGIAERAFGGYWEWISHNVELANEQLTPISPGAKLIRQRSAIEQYEKEQVFGTKSAFWGHPYRDFIKPFIQMFANAGGDERVPRTVQTKREIEEYFDILKWTKFSRLANFARAAKDEKAVAEFERKKNETLFGVNPYTMSFTSVYRALPRRDRDYFKEFSAAETPEEQKKILDLVPKNEKALYVARWQLMNVQKLKDAKKAGVLSEAQIEEADEIIEDTYDKAKNEGFPTNKELMAEFFATKQKGENYADWYRRTRLLPEVPHMPGPDWIGWNPVVDMEDVKYKLIKAIGADPIEYNLWPSRGKRLPYKPYLEDEDVLGELMPEQQYSGEEIRSRINTLLASSDIRPNVYITPSSKNEINLSIEQEPDYKQLKRDVENV